MARRVFPRGAAVCVAIAAWISFACSSDAPDPNRGPDPAGAGSSAAGAAGEAFAGSGDSAGTSAGAAGGADAGASGSDASAGEGGEAGSDPGCECPVLECKPPSYVKHLAGQCCPICADDPAIACAGGQADYVADKELVTKYDWVCSVADDCAVMLLNNSCEQCVLQVAWSYAAPGFQSHINDYALSACSECPIQDPPPCDPLPPVYCTNGLCSLTP